MSFDGGHRLLAAGCGKDGVVREVPGERCLEGFGEVAVVVNNEDFHSGKLFEKGV
jgi:hypothetical protein